MEPESCIRLRYAKEWPLNWISHLDTMRTLERALRRAGLPVALTQGFHPRPRISYGPALPVGFTSEAEYADVELTEKLEPELVLKRLNDVLPAGMRVLRAGVLRGPRRRSLASILEVAGYRVKLSPADAPASGSEPGPEPDLEKLGVRLRELMDSKYVPYRRTGPKGEKTVDLRESIIDLRLVDSEIEMLLLLGGQGAPADDGNGSPGARPTEILEVLNLDVSGARFHRTGLFERRWGQLWSPLDSGS